MKNKIYRENIVYKDFKKVREKIKLNTLYNSYQKKILKYYVGLAKLKKHSKALELGCQFALFNNVFHNYIGIDINPKLIKFARKLHKKINLKVASATKLPFKKEIDFLFSFATIEHIKRPDLVFREIDRVLNKGGTLLLAPAWNCRKYTVQKLEHRDYKDLSITLKLSKFFIPLQNNLLLRGMIRLPVRIYDELLYLLKKKTFSDQATSHATKTATFHLVKGSLLAFGSLLLAFGAAVRPLRGRTFLLDRVD